MNEQRQVFTLRQVVSSIRKTIEDRYQSLYWVKAEMHKLNLYPSGHAFPELVHKEDGKIVAQINASIWKANLQRINQQFIQVLKEPLKEGATLLMQVKISFSEQYGISLQILDIDPSYTLGELQRERQETLLRLKNEGLINKNQLVDFPLLPKRIAIISADTSKGLSDFMKVLNQNPYGYQFVTHLFFAYLQGDQAVQSISKQLKAIEKLKDLFDVVVIVRGGGGEVGLSCYNNYELCKAIAQCSLPVLTGIGHSTNLTVAEMIAFRNAITPTELADYLIQSFHEFAIPVQNAQETILRVSKLLIDQSKQEFQQTVKYFRNAVNVNLTFHHNNWQTISRKLNAKVELATAREHQQLKYCQQSLHANTKRLFAGQRTYLDDSEQFLKQGATKILEKKTNELATIQKHVKILDPINVLKRGYSIARLNGHTIGMDTKLIQGDRIEITTAAAEIIATVYEINKRNDHE